MSNTIPVDLIVKFQKMRLGKWWTLCLMWQIVILKVQKRWNWVQKQQILAGCCNFLEKTQGKCTKNWQGWSFFILWILQIRQILAKHTKTKHLFDEMLKRSINFLTDVGQICIFPIQNMAMIGQILWIKFTPFTFNHKKFAQIQAKLNHWKVG